MNKLFKRLIAVIVGIAMVGTAPCVTEAFVLTGVVIEKDGTEFRKLKYTTRSDVLDFVRLLSSVYDLFRYDFYDSCQGFWTPEDNNVPYEYLWTMLWSKYMFQEGQGEQELERSKFLAHMILSNCVKDRFMKVCCSTLRNSIASILRTVMNSGGFTIEVRKPKGRMWQDWRITTF